MADKPTWPCIPADRRQEHFGRYSSKLIFPKTNFSATVTVGVVPEGLTGSTIVRHMYANYRTVIASQRTKLDNRVIRIGTMGFVGPADILADLHYLECTLRDLGRAPTPGAGVEAAAAVLAAKA